MMKNAIKTIIRRTVKLPPDVTNIHDYEVLEILLREALQNTPEWLARRMVESYMSGEEVFLILAQSNYGKNKQTAFDWGVMPVRDLPAPKGNA